MKKRTATPSRTSAIAAAPQQSIETSFADVMHLIEAARRRADRAVNAILIDLYWEVGEYIGRRISADGWGKGTVIALAAYIQKRQPGIRGFSPQNLWRMRQFFEAYRGQPKLSTLLRQLPWSSNLHILTKTKQPKEREFYLRAAVRSGWQVREVARQINGGLYERTILNPPKLSTVLRELHPQATTVFKDSYLLEFLGLPPEHSEADLHDSLLRNLGRFITELGRDFCFVGSQYPIQVGGRDFALDLLFFHRGLNCLVAVELKVGEFQPEHLGKLEFYLEALDRDVRKPNERPSIGLLLCATKDKDVVEYALSRSLSPAMIAEYKTMLPEKKLLEDKLHELYQLLGPEREKTPQSGRQRKHDEHP
jgi:predicted nuclease of restriction endonuclease-like (RecB) superfamily